MAKQKETPETVPEEELIEETKPVEKPKKSANTVNVYLGPKCRNLIDPVSGKTLKSKDPKKPHEIEFSGFARARIACGDLIESK